MAVEAQEGPRRGADLNKDEKVGRYLKDKNTTVVNDALAHLTLFPQVSKSVD